LNLKHSATALTPESWTSNLEGPFGGVFLCGTSEHVVKLARVKFLAADSQISKPVMRRFAPSMIKSAQ
jgi:hypothetical protein